MDNPLRDLVVADIGETKTVLLERLIKLHTGEASLAAPRIAGAMVRQLAKQGGVFGWTQGPDIALGLNVAIPLVLGKFEPKEHPEFPGMQEALDTLAMLVPEKEPLTEDQNDAAQKATPG